MQGNNKLTKTLYLSRDKEDGGCQDLWAGKPTEHNGTHYQTGENSTILQTLCDKLFLPLFGINLKPGECKRVEVTIKLHEPKKRK